MKIGIVLRWVAHFWAIASTLLLLIFAFGGREHLRFNFSEAVLFLFFPFGVIFGFVLAWRRELLGGIITVGSFVIFCVLMFIRMGRLDIGPYFIVFAAPGFLHIVSWFFNRRSALVKSGP